MDIFEYVKEKLSRNDDSYSNLRFRSWRESNLDIDLLKDTSILNLAYRDTDKDLIIQSYKKYQMPTKVIQVRKD